MESQHDIIEMWYVQEVLLFHLLVMDAYTTYLHKLCHSVIMNLNDRRDAKILFKL